MFVDFAKVVDFIDEPDGFYLIGFIWRQLSLLTPNNWLGMNPSFNEFFCHQNKNLAFINRKPNIFS